MKKVLIILMEKHAKNVVSGKAEIDFQALVIVSATWLLTRAGSGV